MPARTFRLFLLFALLVAGTAAAQTRAPVQPVDRIVAVVNNEAITQQELNERVRLALRQMKAQNVPAPPLPVLEKQLLERMITERVQLQFARQTGIRVDDVQLDRALLRIAAANNMSIDQFRQAVEQDGVPFAKFREEIRNEIILSRLREREAENRVTVSDAEVEQFFASPQGQQKGETEYHLAHILIRVPEQAGPEIINARRARAEQALAEIRKGTPFAQVAASYSDAPDALNGGDLGWRPASRLPELFLPVLNALKPGEVSEVIRSPAGFHILKLNDKRGKDTPLVVEQTHARHILIRVNELTSEADAKRRLLALKERIENGADFGELARLNSEDASAAKGGDLGWLSPGDTVPEFERAMNALPVGGLSDPVQTPFGWHLIQVLERRHQDVTDERRKLQARLQIRERKADEAYQEFVRQLRDQAYVEYRLEER
ncbi:peptidylprolyl isomerase [Thiobacter aerophilum]|uniref:Chaperone SurA n=1 Tax=Thiobacter aerophilum TaxID=3121275 RepID=A0ABV0EFG5_9BURK